MEKKMRVVVFSNRQKKAGENTPDFRIYVSKDRDENSETAVAVTGAETAVAESVSAVSVEENEETL